MEFFIKLIDVVGKIVMISAIGVGIVGAMMIAEGNSEQNPAAKSMGWKVLGGAFGGAIIAQVVIPLLKDYLNF